MSDVSAMVSGYALESANCYRFPVNPLTPTGRFTWSVTCPAENRRKHVRYAVDHVSVSISALCYQANVFRNVGMRGTSPLAINDFVKIRRIGNIGWFHEK